MPRRAAQLGHDMLVLPRCVLVVSVFLLAVSLGMYLLSLIALAQLCDWPGIEGPRFPLIAGQSGTWELQWPLPLREGWDRSEVRLATERQFSRPDSVEVLVGVDPLVSTSHGCEWLGAPTEWMYRGIGILPVRNVRRPLILDDMRGTRLSWTVKRVDAELAGTSAQVVLSAPSPSIEFAGMVRSRLRQSLLPMIGLFACVAIRACFRIRTLSSRARERIPSPRIEAEHHAAAG